MMRGKTCPKCQGSMAEGFIVGERHGAASVPGWMEGKPVSKWYGLKIKGKPISVATYRCGRCGFLEQYAQD